MKPVRIILLLLLPFIGSTGFAQSGMTVFGDCYVQEKASMSIWVDKLTLEDDVMGDGKLVMAGKATQTIDAEAKAVNNLVIRNSNGVKVKGKLTVQKSLTIEQGNLEVLPQAQLDVSPRAIVTLFAGCYLIRSGENLKTGSDALSQTPKPFLLSCDVPETTEGQEGSRAYQRNPKTAIATLTVRYDSPSLQRVMPPPWVAFNRPSLTPNL